jgi:hypothetical protein
MRSYETRSSITTAEPHARTTKSTFLIFSCATLAKSSLQRVDDTTVYIRLLRQPSNRWIFSAKHVPAKRKQAGSKAQQQPTGNEQYTVELEEKRQDSGYVLAA